MEESLEDFHAQIRAPERVLSTFLKKVVPLSNGWATALCPFHDDSSPSLSVNLSSGNWICHACKQTGSYFELPGNTGEAVPVKAYAYAEDLNVKYLKVRYFPKTFRFFSVKDGLVYPGKNGHKPILYNWDIVKKTAGDVYVVEGEKDVDSLSKKGILAVTGGGASNWSHEFSDLLRDRKVYLIPDNDEAGKKWCHTVCETLRPSGVIHFPNPKVKDITEWFEMGNAFKNLILRPPPNVRVDDTEIVELKDFKAPEKLPDILDGLIPRGFVTLLYGDGGEGKSFLSLLITHYIVKGANVLGRKTSPEKCLYLDWELGVDEHVDRAHRISRGMGLEGPPAGLFYKRANGSFTMEEETVRRFVKENNIGLVVVDSLGASCSGDTNSSQAIIALFKSFLSLGVTFLVIDHVAKPGDFGETYKPFGSVYKHNLARSTLKIVKQSENENGFTVKIMQFKNNFGPLADPIVARFVFEEGSVRLV